MSDQHSSSPDSLSVPLLTLEEVQEEIHLARQAAARYHRLLQAPGVDLGRMRADFERDMLSEKLDYGPRMLCDTLRPHFITASLHAYVERVASTVTRALLRLGRLGVDSPEIQDAIGLTDVERELVAIDPGYADASALSRLDAFVSDQGLHLIEINGEAPTGVGYNERLFRVFDRLPPMREFQVDQRLRTTDGTAMVLDTLLEVYREWGGQGTPRVAIVDWKGLVTQREFEIFAEHFESRGVRTRIVDPLDLEIHQGRLVADGEPIDLVYRRVITTEFIDRRATCQALEVAYRERLACFVNSFRSKFLHKKLSFSLLHDPRFRSLLSDEEASLARRHVPTTWALRPRPLHDGGEEHDPLEFAVTHRDELVLKPNDDYGGRGLMLGRETEPDRWREGIAHALADGSDPRRLMVLQRRIPLFQEDFPNLEGRMDRYYVDLDPFFFREQMFGFLTRMSVRAISNVSAGGGQIPTYILEG